MSDKPVIESNINLDTPGQNDNNNNNNEFNEGLILENEGGAELIEEEGINENINEQDINNEIEGKDEELEFMDEDDDDWNDDDELIDIDADNQPMIKHDENDLLIINEGKEPKQQNPNQQRCWKCQCGVINSILQRMTKGCVQCYTQYPVGKPVEILWSEHYQKERNNIIGDDNGKIVDGKQVYQVWFCPACSLANHLDNTKCIVCNQDKPGNDELHKCVGYHPIKPEKKVADPVPDINRNRWYSYDNDDNNKNKNNNNNNNDINEANWKDYSDDDNESVDDDKKDEKFEVLKKLKDYIKPKIDSNELVYQDYPNINSLNDCNANLLKIFGYPYQNTNIIDGLKKINIWDNINTINIECDIPLFDPNKIDNKKYTFNDNTSDLLMIYDNTASIFSQIDNKYKLMASAYMNYSDEITNYKFYNNTFYIFRKKKSIIEQYQYNKKLSQIIFIGLWKDEYLSAINVIDFDIIDNMLLILFNKWIGMYKIKDNFNIEWYHAVTISRNYCNSNSFKIINTNVFNIDKINVKPYNIKYLNMNKYHTYIHIKNAVIGIHPSNATFEHYCPAKGDNINSYVVSNKYGMFWSENNIVYHSRTNDYDSCQAIKLPQDDNKNKCDIHSLFYDEYYGIHGRLLILYKNNTISQYINETELNPFTKKLSNYIFNKLNYYQTHTLCIILTYLYGNTLTQNLISNIQYIKLKKTKSNLSLKTIINYNKYHLIKNNYQSNNFDIKIFENTINKMNNIIINDRKSFETYLLDNNKKQIDNKIIEEAINVYESTYPKNKYDLSKFMKLYDRLYGYNNKIDKKVNGLKNQTFQIST